VLGKGISLPGTFLKRMLRVPLIASDRNHPGQALVQEHTGSVTGSRDVAALGSGMSPARASWLQGHFRSYDSCPLPTPFFHVY
jgi:hypothetical protein